MPQVIDAPAVVFAEIGTLADLPVGLGRAYRIGPHRLAVYRTRDGAVFAVDDKCPHKGGPLSDGMLAGDQIVCPLHNNRFQGVTGECEAAEVCPVTAYPVEVVGDVVKVGVPVG